MKKSKFSSQIVLPFPLQEKKKKSIKVMAKIQWLFGRGMFKSLHTNQYVSFAASLQNLLDFKNNECKSRDLKLL